MVDADSLRAHADRLRASGVLGRSPHLQRLFEFLLECSLADRAPKEIEVAMDAFGKGAGFDVSQDAMVRVYVHKLRRKLEDFYAGPGLEEPTRLVIPKGEYRFVVESVTDPTAPAAGAPPAPAYVNPAAAGRRKWLIVGLVASIVLNAAVLIKAYFRPPAPGDDFATIRRSPLWAPILDGDRPIFVVVGDYYIFGETDDGMDVKRLVREFNINSSQDLEQYLKLHPELEDKFTDMELAYLPTAAAYALRDVIPVLAAANRRLRVVTMSQFNPVVLKTADVIYVGYLSGLGRLKGLVFETSRLEVGESYDEIIDRRTKQRYVSQAAMPYPGESRYHDYGYVATFAGPDGNRIVVLAGTRDVAAMHMGETVTNSRSLATLVQSAGQPDFEALYEVYGMDQLNLDGKLLLTAPRDSTRIWTDIREPFAEASH